MTSSRPPDSRSRVASCLASRTGLRPGRTMVVPIFRRGAWPAAYAMAARGSSPGTVRTSDHHKESNPLDSRSSTIWPSSSPDMTDVPVPIPMRTFTAEPGGHRAGTARPRVHRCEG